MKGEAAVKLPRATRWLAPAERGLIGFLDMRWSKCRRRRPPDVVDHRQAELSRARLHAADRHRRPVRAPSSTRPQTWLSANALRIVVALAVGAVLVAALLFIQKLAQRLCRDNAELVDWKTIVGRIAAKTSFWFLVIVAAKLVDGYADTPPLLDKTIGFLFTVAFTFQAAVWVRELVLGFVEHRAGMTDQDHGALASATGIIRFLVSFTLFSLALVLVLGNLGVNVTGLVAGLGVGGIAIGLAAQGIFKDLFAALAIIFDRPFPQGRQHQVE